MSEGQKAGLEPHLSRGQAGEGRGPGAHQISWNGTFLPLAAGPHRWTDLRGGSDAHLPASDDKQGNGASPRQSSLAGCLKPRASRRIPNFRNQTGTCLTKINPAPNIYFYRDFAAVEAGRSTRATGRCACCPPGQSPRLPTGGPCRRSWQGTTEGSLLGEVNTAAGAGSVSAGFQPLKHQLWTSEPFQIPFSHG